MPYGKVIQTEIKCPKCGGAVEAQSWESSDGAYEDWHYKCTVCKDNWWVDGPDA